MADQEERPAVLGQHLAKRFARLDIQVVCRFIQDQKVSRAEEHTAEGQLVLLATREHVDVLEDIIADEEKAREIPA